MFKKMISLIVLIAFLAMPEQLSYTGAQNFLVTADAVNDNTTAVHGVGFTSTNINISQKSSLCVITVWFTPAAGAAVNIEFRFAVSNDAGSTYSTEGSYYIAIPTNTRAVGSVVRWSEPFDMSGISHMRLEQIVVGNGAGNCTVINARISY